MIEQSKIRNEKKDLTDWAVKNGFAKNMFVVTAEGNVYRRKPASNDYAFCGALANPTEERKAAVLEALRNANPERIAQQITGGVRKAQYANFKQAQEIVERF